MVEVEPQYTGAKIEGEVVTLDFVKKMIDGFKNQKSLHKRYVWWLTSFICAMPYARINCDVAIGFIL